MQELIIDNITNYGTFSSSELELLVSKLELREFQKGDLLLKKGDICDVVYFIVSGAVCHYGLDDDLNKNYIDLNVAQDWVTNHHSFTAHKPSEYFIEAFENTLVYQLTIQSIHHLIAKSQTFLQLGKILNDSTSRINFFDHSFTPDEKYLFILENKPELIQKFPSKIIAAYLKITPETLSRVRARTLNS